jgi:hypothetical protein
MKLFTVFSLFFTLATCSTFEKLLRGHTHQDTAHLINDRGPNVSLGDTLFAYIFVFPFIGNVVGLVLSGLVCATGIFCLYHGLSFIYRY